MRRSSILILIAAVSGCQAAHGPRVLTLGTAAETQTAMSAQKSSGVSAAEFDALIEKLRSSPDPHATIIEISNTLKAQARHAEYLREAVALMQHNLNAQVRSLTATRDLETIARLLELLSFMDGINRFLADAVARPPSAARDALIGWALAEENLEITALTYDHDPAQRAEATRRLNAIKAPEADALLARLIKDPDREVALRAMDAAGNRAASATLVNALWLRAVIAPAQNLGYGAVIFDPEGSPQPVVVSTLHVVTVHGRPITIAQNNQGLASLSNDSDAATDVLVGYKSKLVADRLTAFLTGDPKVGSGTEARLLPARMLSPSAGTISSNLSRLLAAYQPRAVVPTLVKSVLTMPNDGYTQEANNLHFRISTRIDMLASLLDLTGVAKEDYGIRQMPNFGTRWVMEGGDKADDVSMKKLAGWWRLHFREYGGEASDLPPF